MGLVMVSATALSTTTFATSSEQVSSSAYQFVPFAGVARLACRGSATGMQVQLAAAGQTLCSNQAIPFTGTAGAILADSHEMLSFPVEEGARIELRFFNNTAGTLTTDYILSLDAE